MSDSPDSGKARFGPFRLDLEIGELRRDGAVVPLRPKPMAVLVYLVREAGSLVPRERLLEAAWDDAHVKGDTALHGAVREIRRALGDDASRPQFVETVHRRGYRFLAPVRPEGAGGTEAPAEATGRWGRPMEILTAGHRLGWPARVLLTVAASLIVVALLVTARPAINPAPPMPHSPVLEAPSAVLHARYLVGRDSSIDVSRGAAILRAAVGSDDGGPLAWAGLAVAEMKLGRYEPSMAAARRALELYPGSVDAHRVLGQLGILTGDVEEAESHALRALELDPATGRSQHGYALVLAATGRIDEAIAMAEAARALAPRMQVVQANLARYRLIAGDYDGAVREARRALDLDPDDADGSASALETLQAAAWAQGELDTAHDAAVRLAAALGAPGDLLQAWRDAPAYVGLQAALRWRIDYYDKHRSLGPNRHVRAAVLYVQLGDADSAARQLGRIEGRATALPLAFWDPRLQELASRPELQRLADGYGLGRAR